MHTKNSKEQGDIAEAYAAAKMLEKGWEVSKPLGDNYTYDYVVKIDDKFEKIQVKSSSYKNGVIKAWCNRYYTNLKKNVKYKKEEVDFFVVYSPELNKCYVVGFNERNAKSQITLRVEPSKNGQHKNIQWAKDFEI